MVHSRCRACGGELSNADAKACPWCGSEIRDGGTPVWGWVVLPMLIVYLFVNSGNDSRMEPDSSAQESARSLYEEALFKSLESTRSIKSEAASQWVVEELSDGTLLVHATGLITNALGIDVEQAWDCAVSRNGDGLQLDSLHRVMRR